MQGSGTITSVLVDKGFGFISGNLDRDLFFHRSALRRSLQFEESLIGKSVSFEYYNDGRGPRVSAVWFAAEPATQPHGGATQPNGDGTVTGVVTECHLPSRMCVRAGGSIRVVNRPDRVPFDAEDLTGLSLANALGAEVVFDLNGGRAMRVRRARPLGAAPESRG